MKARVPHWELPVLRFLRGEARLQSAAMDGEVFSLWDALIYFPDSRYPIRLGAGFLVKEDLKMAARTLLRRKACVTRLARQLSPEQMWALRCVILDSTYGGVPVPAWLETGHPYDPHCDVLIGRTDDVRIDNSVTLRRARTAPTRRHESIEEHLHPVRAGHRLGDPRAKSRIERHFHELSRRIEIGNSESVRRQPK